MKNILLILTLLTINLFSNEKMEILNEKEDTIMCKEQFIKCIDLKEEEYIKCMDIYFQECKEEEPIYLEEVEITDTKTEETYLETENENMSVSKPIKKEKKTPKTKKEKDTKKDNILNKEKELEEELKKLKEELKLINKQIQKEEV